MFYGWWDWRFLGLLAASTLVDYSVGRRMEASVGTPVARRLLWTSIGFNLGILGLFKYANFFVDSAAALAESVGFEPNTPTLNVLLPVGISFYTFQTMSYTFDIYRGRIPACRSLVTFAAYVSYFPQLVAGPIERAQRLLPRIETVDRVRPVGVDRDLAFSLILVGLVKKVVIADGLAPLVNSFYDDPSSAGFLPAVVALIAFSFQIYGDFSGYTDIARGVSKLLGIDLMVNFREPYLSRNITEFWRRWHISLSDWLRDYLYIPLGGNRGSSFATYRNLLLTMLLGGLWHGASWNFVIWGALHGAYLAILRRRHTGTLNMSDRVSRYDLPTIVMTFVVVTLTWVPFRAATLADTGEVFAALTRFEGSLALADLALLLTLSTLAIIIDVMQRRQSLAWRKRQEEGLISRPLVNHLVIAMAVAALFVFSGRESEPFIYFQF